MVSGPRPPQSRIERGEAIADPRRSMGCAAGERHGNAAGPCWSGWASPRRNFQDRLPRQLSGGQQQQAIARALALDPQVLICDESVSMLDAEVQAEVLSLLRTLQRDLGLALIFVTHDLTVASGFCHRLIVLDQGRIGEEGPGARPRGTPDRHQPDAGDAARAYRSRGWASATGHMHHDDAAAPEAPPGCGRNASAQTARRAAAQSDSCGRTAEIALRKAPRGVCHHTAPQHRQLVHHRRQRASNTIRSRLIGWSRPSSALQRLTRQLHRQLAAAAVRDPHHRMVHMVRTRSDGSAWCRA